MKALKLSVATLALLCLHLISIAQAVCGFDAVHQQKIKTDPAYQANVLSQEASIRQYIQSHPVIPKAGSISTLSTLYTIPVVVHVVHTGGAVGTIYNPTDAQIQGAIDYLNQVYNGTYPGTVGAGDLQIQFALAKRDPNCNPTGGINRVDGSGISGYTAGGVNVNTTSGTDELNLKNLIRWNTSQYYNIWVVNKIDGADGTSGTFIAGFAYFPGSGSSYDGTIMLATQMITGQKTLPHEIGHAFNLYHPFEGSSGTTCPTNANCNTDGDMVCDTDPITQPAAFACRTGSLNACTGTVYNINTESNYMNYTNCYTLFTAGQKTRMLAAAGGVFRLSLSTSQGATATNAGASPCPPKINFELDADRHAETTTGTSGCRSYTDYSYNMVIGNSPSAAATATLSVTAGTATEGVDFDITTNGNFAAPSKVVNFPSGTNASQAFTIRIYDDASVESTETFTLGFSVNNGGGDALAGDGKPNLTITLDDNDAAPVAGTSTGTVSVGTAASLLGASPFDARQTSHRMQFQYKASELTAAGLTAGSLSGILLRLQKFSTRAFTNFNIKMGTSAVNYLINGSVTTGSSMATVKTLSSYTTVNGWNTFTFDTPYTWDGTSNLVIEICYDNGSAAAGDAADNIYGYSDGGTGTQGNMFWQNGINCGQGFSSVGYYANGTKPIIQINYGIPATAVEGTLNASKQEYLGANADVYFYNQADGKLMARISNLSSFDYGCTQVVVDRAGTSASAFWNNTTANYLMDKTFHVIPATNNSSGNYTITLYYSQAEVNGWQTATGNSFSNINLVKVPGQILSVTPGNPTGGGTVTSVIPTRGTLGTNSTLTYSFANGFSGFGAGIIGTPLPVTLMQFNGRLLNEHANLSWVTTAESNSSHFDIERSYNGNAYTKIGEIAAAGNSVLQKQYVYRDPSLAEADNFYRLKAVDLDGKYSYSEVVELKDAGTGSFTVLNNPFTTFIDLRFDKPLTSEAVITLRDLTGHEIYHTQVNAAGSINWHVDLGGKTISAGTYLLQVKTAEKLFVQKVVKVQSW